MGGVEIPAEVGGASTIRGGVQTPGRIVFATLTGVFACFWILPLVVVMLKRSPPPPEAPWLSASMLRSFFAGILLVYLASLTGILMRWRWGWCLTVLMAAFWFFVGIIVGVAAQGDGTSKRFGFGVAVFFVVVSSSYLVYFWRRAIRRAYAIELPWSDLWAWLSVCGGIMGLVVASRYPLPMPILWWVPPAWSWRLIGGLSSLALLVAGAGVMRRTGWGWYLAMLVLSYSFVATVIALLFPNPDLEKHLMAIFPRMAMAHDQFRDAWKWSVPMLGFNVLVGIELLVSRARFLGGGARQ